MWIVFYILRWLVDLQNSKIQFKECFMFYIKTTDLSLWFRFCENVCIEDYNKSSSLSLIEAVISQVWSDWRSILLKVQYKQVFDVCPLSSSDSEDGLNRPRLRQNVMNVNWTQLLKRQSWLMSLQQLEKFARWYSSVWNELDRRTKCLESQLCCEATVWL